MQKISKKIVEVLKSPRFFGAIVVVFLLQSLFFAVAVEPSYISIDASGNYSRGDGVVPDGNRHIGAIYYFAERPLLSAPFITDQTDHELWMGDLERFPSYLYYWVLSLPVKMALVFDAPDWAVILLIRLVGVVIGLLVLIVFRKIVRELKVSEIITNLSTLALALTGSLAYLAPAENYDVPALLLFFLFTLAALRLITLNDGRQLYFMALWFMLASITKYTYIPFMGLLGLIAFGLFIRKNDGFKSTWAKIKNQFAKLWQTRKWLVVGGLVLLVVSTGLFAERIGGNLVQYQSFNPNCAEVHSHQACMNFGVYSRNHIRTEALENNTAQERHSYNFFDYTVMWIARYFSSMYAYMGHVWIPQFWPAMYVGGWMAVLATVAMLIYLKAKRQKILDKSQQKIIGLMVVVFVIMQYLFNVRTYLNFEGMTYAHQGRYLLPAIGFVYVLILMVAVKFVRLQPLKRRKIIVPILLVICVILLATLSALPVWFAHADGPAWYSEPFEFLVN